MTPEEEKNSLFDPNICRHCGDPSPGFTCKTEGTLVQACCAGCHQELVHKKLGRAVGEVAEKESEFKSSRELGGGRTEAQRKGCSKTNS